GGTRAGGGPLFGRAGAVSHHNPYEKLITPRTAARLKPRWVFQTHGDVSSQPVVAQGVVYFGSWDGKEDAVEAKTGTKIWESAPGQSSRSAAAYADGTLYFGDIAGFLHALDARTGALKWKKRVDTHPNTVATSSPIYHQGRLYLGVSSHEEGAMLRQPDYRCCTFRGSVVAFDAAKGDDLWRFYVFPGVPAEIGKDKRDRAMVGPAGGAIWSTI